MPSEHWKNAPRDRPCSANRRTRRRPALLRPGGNDEKSSSVARFADGPLDDEFNNGTDRSEEEAGLEQHRIGEARPADTDRAVQQKDAEALALPLQTARIGSHFLLERYYLFTTGSIRRSLPAAPGPERLSGPGRRSL